MGTTQSYVNFLFPAGQGFTRVTVISTDFAFEFDDVAIAKQRNLIRTFSSANALLLNLEVPEPASLALFGASLAGLGLLHRRKKKRVA